MGRLDRPGQPPALVSGQIDRLVVTEREVLIVDYKTNHAPPEIAAEAPAGYVRQLALYRAVLAKLYPQLPVRAALLWTETPDLMEISAPALDAALASYHLGVTALDPARIAFIGLPISSWARFSIRAAVSNQTRYSHGRWQGF